MKFFLLIFSNKNVDKWVLLYSRCRVVHCYAYCVKFELNDLSLHEKQI